MTRLQGDPPASLENLANEVWKDLDPEAFGLLWMAVDTATRILLSDHLSSGLESMGMNLSDAHHHLDSFERARVAREKALLTHQQRAWRRRERASPIDPPSPRRDRYVIQLNADVGAFFRAVGSVLDNLGLAIAIIGAFRVEVVERFTWPRLLSAIRNNVTLKDEQEAVRRTVSKAIEAAGPANWLDWTIEMRNMLVHRPKRISMLNIVVDRRRDGRPIKVRHHLLLPKEPGLSDIEFMRSSHDLGESLLAEPAQATMQGVLGSTRTLVNSVTEGLYVLYCQRRSEPRLLAQPLEQWRQSILPVRRTQLFDGYRPGSAERVTAADLLAVGEHLGQRMRAGAVLDSRGRASWPAWLAAAESARVAQPKTKRGRPRIRRRRAG